MDTKKDSSFSSTLLTIPDNESGTSCSRISTEDGINDKTCRICAKVFRDKYHVKRHEKKCSNGGQCQPKGHKCSKCAKLFRDHYNLKRHEKKCSNGGQDQPSKDHKCFKCAKIFRYHHNLKRHEKTCKNARVHKCSKCDKQLRDDFNLQRHERNCSSGEALHYKCSKCNRMFGKQCLLQRHERTCSLSRGEYSCAKCKKTYNTLKTLKRHSKDCAHSMSGPTSTTSLYGCETCNTNFRTVVSLQEHVHKQHTRKGETHCSKYFRCGQCNKVFDSVRTLHKHVRARHPVRDQSSPGSDYDLDPDYVQDRHSRYDGTLITYTMRPQQAEVHDLLQFLANRRSCLRKNILRDMRTLRNVKWNVCATVKMCKYDAEGNLKDQATPVFRSVTQPVVSSDVINDQIDEAYFKIGSSLDAFKRSGSGWILDSVIKLEQMIIKYNPLRASSQNIFLPYFLALKQSLLNVCCLPENEPNSCFKWAVIAGLYSPVDNVGDEPWQRLSEHRHKLKFGSIKDGPSHVAVHDIPTFENLNGITVNVIGYETDFFPVYMSAQRHVNLLLFETDSIDGPVTQYCAIKDLSKLAGCQMFDGNRQHYFCCRCLRAFKKKEHLEEHVLHCNLHSAAKIVMPPQEKKWVKFRNYCKQMSVSFAIVADFQCYSHKIYDINEPTTGSVVRERMLEPCAWSYFRVSVEDSHPSDPKMYIGGSPDEVMKAFLDAMEQEEKEVFEVLKNKQPITWCDRGFRNLVASNDLCHICLDPFLPRETRVVDHSHVTGLVRGFAHVSCNLNYKEANFLPIFIENLGSCEGRLLMSAIGRHGYKNVSVIAQNIDNFISLSVNRCRYLDTRRFLDQPLGRLVESFASTEGENVFKYTRQYVQPEKFSLFLRELHFCHEHFDGPERLVERNLPSKAGFFNAASNKETTEDGYGDALQLWESMECESIGQYLEAYLLGRVLQLADVFTCFRQKMLSDFQLDAAHYFSLPGLAWDSALKMSGATLELITDPDIHLFVESSIRGGLASIGSPRLAQANHDGLPDGQFDPAEPPSYLQYFDFNGLYACVMRDFALPTHGFRWLSDFEIDRLNLLDIQDNSETGFLVECDLQYPNNLHEMHDTLPLAAEYINILQSDLSEFTTNLANQAGVNIQNAGRKLCMTLREKKKYIVHYINLKLYIRLGLKVTQVHRVLAFKQSKWLAGHMNFLTEKRKSATDEFGKSLYKLLAVAVYGKSLQNSRNFTSVKICTNSEQLQKLVTKPSFGAVRVYTDDSELCLVEMLPTKVNLNKCITVGSCILELSKCKVYSFFYDNILSMFPVTETRTRTVNVLMCNTDGLLIQITGFHRVNEILSL